ncbi:MAG: sodium:proton antiporter [Woeseiaceae bacterium]|jgi:tetracycline resistance efflux pump|nr:sodium:proton antiporter [Woeseiaceae bacterium]|tara:strand:+ start:3341 stop:4753 length:1413 start_codon:yes stop_codon:yes gene_type:complete
MTDPSWYSILPPILAIILAIWTKQVILSLFAGIWIGTTVLSGFNPLAGVTGGLDGIVNVFTDPGDARVLIFTLIIGALIATIEHSGGVRGFVHFLETRRWVHNSKRAQILAWATGLVIFIESNITLLVAGSVSRPLFDRYKISREKLAYLIDATSAPVCVMIPLNAWGAVIIGLIASTGIENPLEIFIEAIPYNFYAIAAIILSAIVIWKNINIGPMKKAEARTQAGDILWPGATPMVDIADDTEVDESAPVPSALLMVLPIAALIIMMPIGLYITGDGKIIEGSGSVSILWSVSFALVVSWTMILVKQSMSINDLMKIFMKGAGGMLPIATILLFALALGDVANALGTGLYVATAVGDTIPAPLLSPLIFLVSAFIAFSVGSSWGTFAIMIPIAIPIATTLGLPVPLLLGAALSGAIFGDHASPISDTTVVASMASATDHIDHVRTQLPYALIAAAFATLAFLLAGIMS